MSLAIALFALLLAWLPLGSPAFAGDGPTPTPEPPLPIVTEQASPTPETVPDTPTAHIEPPTLTAVPTLVPVLTQVLPTFTHTPVPVNTAPPSDTPVPQHTTNPVVDAYPSVGIVTDTPEPPSATPVPTRVVIATPTRTGTATRTATPTATSTSTWLPPGPDCYPKPGPVVMKLDVPYIQQVTDIGGADGNWACGPTSVAMVLAYYGKLDPWKDYVATQNAATNQERLLSPGTGTPSTKKTPLAAGTDYGPYVTNVYTMYGHTYSAVAADPRGNRVAGLYGAISPGGLADWGRMATVLQWHGLTSKRIGTGWDSIVAALKRGHPVILNNSLTPVGHILVVVGYTKNNHLIVNDPYGDRFSPGYGSTNGKGLFYRLSCLNARSALEVIGTYPPPKKPTATATVTPTPLSSPTSTPTPADSGAALPHVTAGATDGSFRIQWVRTSTPEIQAVGAAGQLPGAVSSEGQSGGSRLVEGGHVQEAVGPAANTASARTNGQPDPVLWGATLLVIAVLGVLSLTAGLVGRRKAHALAAAQDPAPDDHPADR
ncbi:MAG: C39 family peptidase [Chloroflexia bacterium]